MWNSSVVPARKWDVELEELLRVHQENKSARTVAENSEMLQRSLLLEENLNRAFAENRMAATNMG